MALKRTLKAPSFSFAIAQAEISYVFNISIDSLSYNKEICLKYHYINYVPCTIYGKLKLFNKFSTKFKTLFFML